MTAATWPCRFCREYARGVVGNVCGCGTVRGETVPSAPPAPGHAPDPFDAITPNHSRGHAPPSVVLFSED